jgi:alpha-methylacyl-CoA racemase
MTAQIQIMPLQGLKVVEFESIGPGPMCGRMLMGLGAQVTVIQRPTRPGVSAALPNSVPPELDLNHGKTVVELNLKTPDGVARALDLVAQADALIEGLRPGAMEKLGLGPAECHARAPKLVFGRMTGWGQTGPLAHAAGHDLNYAALTGLLHVTQRGSGADLQAPIAAPTFMGDAAGALGLAFGIASGVLHARSTGQGCVIDAAMTDITSMLGALIHLTHAAGAIAQKTDAPLAHSVFHGSPFYDAYRCEDGRWITIGALEPQFYALLLSKLGLSDVDPAQQMNPRLWPELKSRLTTLFAGRPMAHWQALLEGTDVCFAPVLTLEEAAAHVHNATRGSLRAVALRNGKSAVQASPAPRFFAAN